MGRLPQTYKHFTQRLMDDDNAAKLLRQNSLCRIWSADGVTSAGGVAAAVNRKLVVDVAVVVAVVSITSSIQLR